MTNTHNSILIIAPKFFEYEKMITEAVQKAGYTVKLISESVDNINILFRLLTHYFPDSKLTKLVYNKYYSKRITTDNKYVLVIRGGLLSKDIINKVKLSNVNAKFILYQWDSVKLNPNALNIAECFDEVCTFDICDSKEFNWRYVPMFYLDSSKNSSDKNYITFIGSMHSKRAMIANEIYKVSQETNSKYFVYLYTSFLSYIKQKFLKRNEAYKEVRIKDLKFKRMPLHKTLDVYGKTKVMIDYTSPDQSGYSTRTMESLRYKYKLVTNNQYIKEADFYNKANIYVYNEESFKIPIEFIKGEYQLLDQKIYDKYSIDSWVRGIFSL